MTKFIRNESKDYGFCRQGEIEVAPATLIELLGEPSRSHSDNYKVSGGYSYQHTIYADTGVEVYDYKRTSLYDDCLPSPEDFWKSQNPVTFSVGGKSSEVCSQFVDWFYQKLEQFEQEN